MSNNKKPSLYRQNNNKPSLYRGGSSNKPSLYKQNRSQSNRRGSQESQLLEILKLILIMILTGIAKIIQFAKKNPKMTRNVLGLIVIILLAFFLVSSLGTNDNSNNEQMAPSTLIGNNSIGSVYKEGPYGNENSDVKIAYILGVHPREQGAHRLMEQALKEKAKDLNYSYYLYKINVSSDATDFSQSRMNGQLLAQEFAVPDMINNNLTAAVDVHYSNGHWGVSRFMFTPRENNSISNQLSHAICDKFDWMTYYVPPDPTSPEYVTIPLNDGGVGAIIYEAYTEDPTNVTLEHDREIVDFIDNYDFNIKSNDKPFIFF